MHSDDLVFSRSPFILSTEQFFGKVANDRPYEPLDMTTAKWGNVPVREIDPRELVASQYEVSANRLRHSSQNLYNADFGGDEYPLVVDYQGEHYLVDGHHRVVAALQMGEKTVKARVLEQDGGDMR